jgi:hypothetical protein
MTFNGPEASLELIWKKSEKFSYPENHFGFSLDHFRSRLNTGWTTHSAENKYCVPTNRRSNPIV